MRSYKATFLSSSRLNTNLKFEFFSQLVRLNPARVVFDIKLENGAQKVVTVKSALLLKNKTDLPLEIKLDLPTGTVLLQRYYVSNKDKQNSSKKVVLSLSFSLQCNQQNVGQNFVKACFSKACTSSPKLWRF